MNKPELQFPVMCHFRVIAENQEDMHFVIETVMMELGVNSPVEKSNVSHAGKYTSYNISTIVESRKSMERIDRELRSIQGVKMVM